MLYQLSACTSVTCTLKDQSNVYSENEVCLRFISMEWNLFPSDGQLNKCFS